MSSQGSLFVDDIYVALNDVVRALGGYKRAGSAMRPELPADQAGRWLSDCLNRAKREKLDPDQVMWLLGKGREIGCHVAMHFIATTSGYAEPVMVEPEDEIARLRRQFVEAVEVQSHLVERMERLAGAASKATARR